MSLNLEGQSIGGYTIGECLGEGGFGAVYAATSAQGKSVALKFVEQSALNEREGVFQGLEGAHLLPVGESFIHDRFRIFVMPRADYALDTYLAGHGGRLSEADALVVLHDIALALDEISGKVVHRDLKPKNILFYEGRWCLADFGMARLNDVATQTYTFKEGGTLPYVAPERFRLERATSASDVYSFGVMAFELVQGALPFPGDPRHGHLNLPPPAVTQAGTRYQHLVADCLIKSPGGRPTTARLVERVQKLQRETPPQYAGLQQASLAVARTNAEAEAQASSAQQREAQLRQLRQDAGGSLQRIVGELLDLIKEQASTATVQAQNGTQIVMGNATLRVTAPQTPGRPNTQWTLPFTVALESSIMIENRSPNHGYKGRSHALWYADLEKEEEFRWYELAFCSVWAPSGPFRPETRISTDPEAIAAFHTGMSRDALARQPIAIDQGDHEEFVDRWLQWFASASQQGLWPPSTLPEMQVQPNWRR